MARAAGVAEQAAMTEEITAGFGASGFQWAIDSALAQQALEGRGTTATGRRLASKPGYKGITTDAVVPISQLPELVVGAKEDIVASGLSAPIVGHVGDGNFHTVILGAGYPGGDRGRLCARPQDRRPCALAAGRIVLGRARGRHRQARVPRAASTGWRRSRSCGRSRRALDPRGIMNPGKMFLN